MRRREFISVRHIGGMAAAARTSRFFDRNADRQAALWDRVTSMSDGQTIPGGLHGPSLTPSATPLAGPGLGSPDLRSWVMRKSPSIVPGNDQSVYLARRLRRPDRRPTSNKPSLRICWTGVEGHIEVSITLYFGTKRRADSRQLQQAQFGRAHGHRVPGRQPDSEAHDSPGLR